MALWRPRGELAPGQVGRLLPAGERPDRLAALEILRPDGDEFPVLDLLDQHLVLVLVGGALVVGELHRPVERVPAALVERILRLLAIAGRLGRGLAEDVHRSVRGRRVVAGRLAVALLVHLGELLRAGPGHRLRPLRAGEDAVRYRALLRELR